MKSQVSVLLHVMRGLCEDVQAAYPEMRGVSQDYMRLALYCQTRGLGLFTLDLPHLDSLLLRGLETGRLMLEGPLTRRVSKRIKVPLLFRGLWLRVFDKDLCLQEDVDTSAILFLRQIFCLGKRVQVECSVDRRMTTIRNFHNVERELRRPSLEWSDDSISLNRINDISLVDCVSDPAIGMLIPPRRAKVLVGGHEQTRMRDRDFLEQCQRVADFVLNALPTFEPLTFSRELEQSGKGIGFRHGPGAVAEGLGQHEKSCFPNWPHKLQEWFPYEYCGKTIGSPRERPLNHEMPSRLICVPKTAKGPRLIAAEPVAHQWCQQIILRWLTVEIEKSFIGYFINFRRQSLSGDLVLGASLDRKLATVDLSDASDRLTCWTVERMFRTHKSLLSALHAARTRYLKDDLSPDISFTKLVKFASQGTATTFPVQSIVFLIIALASAIGDRKVTLRNILKCRNQVRVFGDDIIIPTHGYARLCRIMELLQLKVNMAKSYVAGHYRESCGTDGYQGDDVTPVKPRLIVADGPDSCQAVVDTSNNLFLKGFCHASHNLTQTLPPRIQRGLRVVGIRESGFSGLTSYCGSDERHLVKRWNSRLHRHEGRIWRLSPKALKRDRNGFETLLDFFASSHSPGNPRTVSEYGRIRKVRSDLLWEPLNYGALGAPALPGGRSS